MKFIICVVQKLLPSSTVFFHRSNTNIPTYDDCETTLKAEKNIHAKIYRHFCKIICLRIVVHLQKIWIYYS